MGPNFGRPLKENYSPLRGEGARVQGASEATCLSACRKWPTGCRHTKRSLSSRPIECAFSRRCSSADYAEHLLTSFALLWSKGYQMLDSSPDKATSVLWVALLSKKRSLIRNRIPKSRSSLCSHFERKSPNEICYISRTRNCFEFFPKRIR